MIFNKPEKPERPTAQERNVARSKPKSKRKSKASEKRRERGERARAQGRKGPPRNPLLAIFYWALVVGLWGMAGLAGLGAIFAYDLPDTAGLTSIEKSPTVTLLAANGDVIATRGDLYGVPVQVDELPAYVEQAVIATEDRRFYYHFGFDPIGFTRAMIENVKAGGIVQGGSTLTQQLAKNIFLTPEQTITRKMRELMLAFWLEYRFTKKEILTIYLNRVYLGAGTYGIDAASRKYFGKPPTELTLPEAAIIAGLLKAPSRYAPTNDLKRSQKRASVVIRNMEDAGYLTKAEADAAIKYPARPTPGSIDGAPRYFVDWALDRLTDYIGRTDFDLVVTTTIDTGLQKMASRTVNHWMNEKNTARDAEQAALILMNHDGAVRAMVGGRDYRKSQFNRAVLAKRQPGSAFKPVVYATALEAGLGPRTVMRDSPIILGDWSPKNYSGTYTGDVRLEDALAESINTVAVKLSERVGRTKVIDMAHRLGIESELPPHPSVALGTGEVSLLELVGIYQAFANSGVAERPHAIAEIRQEDGTLLYKWQAGGYGRVLSRHDARVMTGMLEEVVKSGTGKRARVRGVDIAGKTGTSQDSRDAWFVGYSSDYVIGVWTGNDDATPMNKVTGGGLPALIFRDVMTVAMQGRQGRELDSKQGGGDGFFNDLFDNLFGF